MGFGAFEVLSILLYTVLPVLVLVVLVSVGVRWAIVKGLRDVVSDEMVYTRIKGTPKEILDRRYADGEIGREDYLRIKEDIERDTGNRDA